MAGAIGRLVGNYDDLRSLGSQFRRRRAEPLMTLIDRCFRDRGSVRLLDVGGMEKYWNILDPDWLAARRVRITLSNLPDDLPPITRPDLFEEHVRDGRDAAARARLVSCRRRNFWSPGRRISGSRSTTGCPTRRSSGCPGASRSAV